MLKKQGKGRLPNFLASDAERPRAPGRQPFLSVKDAYGLKHDEQHLDVKFGGTPSILLQPQNLAALKPAEIINRRGYSSLKETGPWWESMNGAVKKRLVDLGWRDLIEAVGVAVKTSNGALAALVERWCDTTHTFHFPVGECTITPSDMVAITGLPWRGPVIEFNCFSSRCSVSSSHLKRTIGYPGSSGRVSYTELKNHWLHKKHNVANAAPVERDKHARAFLLALLSTLLFPTGQSTVELSLLETLEDLDQSWSYNWARAGLAQMYYALDLCARGFQKHFKGFTLVLHIWAIEHGFMSGPKFDGIGAWHARHPWYSPLALWTKDNWNHLLDYDMYQHQLREMTIGQVREDPWDRVLNRGDVEIAKEYDGRRMILESPSSHEWYLGDRVKDWFKGIESRTVPPDLPVNLFWPHLYEPASEREVLFGEGYVKEHTSTLRYIDFMAQLLPLEPPVNGLHDFDNGVHSCGASSSEDASDGHQRRVRPRSEVPDFHSQGAAQNSTASHIVGTFRAPLPSFYTLAQLGGGYASVVVPPHPRGIDIMDPPDATHVTRDAAEDVYFMGLQIGSLMLSEVASAVGIANRQAAEFAVERASFQARQEASQHEVEDLRRKLIRWETEHPGDNNRALVGE